MEGPLLNVKNLKTYFFTTAGVVRAVDDISFDLKKGEALGLAGESGCGKTTTAYSIMRLVPHPGKIVDGHIYFNGDDLIQKTEDEMRKIRWKKISIIFQGAMNALNPVFTVGDQIIEAIQLHEDVSKEEAEERASKLFEMVGLSPSRLFDYPHEFSGGMRQRAMIAMALACNPELVIADEPTTALDVSIQVQILNLLRDLKERFDLSLIVITHDLSIIAELADRVAIMYAGKIVEISDVISMYHKPVHPYAFALIKSVPDIESAKTKKLYSIPGNPPNLINPPSGCRFHPRCPFAKPICKQEDPPIKEIDKGRLVACHFAEDIMSMEIEEIGEKFEGL